MSIIAAFRSWLVLALLLTGGRAALAAAPVNVLFLVADDLGWGDVGFHRGKQTTPNLDRLAKDGVDLQRFYVYPVCSPTRAALLTGQLPRRLGIADVVGPRQNLPRDVLTLPAVFHQAGYQTALIGKWHLGRLVPPTRLGFDHFYGFLGPSVDYFKHTAPSGAADWERDGKPLTEEGYSTFLLADEAVRQLQKRDASRPFFMEVAFNAVHEPLAAPVEYVAKYPHLSATAATYAALVETLDVAVGKILKALDEQGLRNSTLVVFLSDNGAGRLGSNGPLRGGKDTLWEGGIRTPCVMRWPQHIPEGKTSRQPVAAQDLFATLAAAAGMAIPAEAKLDGVDMWPAIRDGKLVEREPIVIAGYGSAVIDGEWKLIQAEQGERWLYHLGNDERESADQLAKQLDVAERLTAKLTAVTKHLPALGPRMPRPAMGRPGSKPAP